MRGVLIAGPTASGKSALALALAEAAGGVVINADSMQVYADLRVLTARPTPDEEARVPHRLYGHVDADADYSVARWVEEAGAAIRAAHEAGRLPILVGGTGLYFKALTAGLAPVPPIPPELRARVRAQAAQDGAGLHARLAAMDPETAERLRPSDTQRLIRAIEVFEATGRPLAQWQAQGGTEPAIDVAEWRPVFLALERERLRARIAARFAVMMEEGALDEVRHLVSRGLDAGRPALKAHGVPWLARYLDGTLSLSAAVEGAVLDTRHYAKRQETWFRHQLDGWPHLAPTEARRYLRGELGL
ncbi:MAG TPA: tRNA (adenosine(37)-N6)-dimethylallyltransferase MiaA [Xanthobacteraceae bacterium]|nr:tRNA (adenosine(37)-N6)-dimethylallyltransferase MiaA [Xanthobacteraceae bacterium]